MRKRIAIHGATEEAFQLIPLLLANPAVEIAAVFDAAADEARARSAALDPAVAAVVEAKLTDDASALTADPTLYAVIDTGGAPGFGARFPEAGERGIQIVSPLTARLLSP